MKTSRISLSERSIRIAISLLAFPLTITQQVVSRIEIIKYKPEGQLINIGSKKLHAIVTGSVSLTVVLEDSWHSIQLHKPDVVIKAIKEMINEITEA